MEQPEYKGYFEIVGTNLVDEGVRLSLTNRMIREGIQWGNVENIGSRTLLIKLGGTKEEVKKFHKIITENFKKWLDEDISEKERLLKKIANPGLEFKEFVEDEYLTVLPIGLHSHALQCQQLRKGVNVFEGIAIALEELHKVNRGLLEELKKRNPVYIR